MEGKMRKWIKRILISFGIIIGAIVALGLLVFFRPWGYLPHKKVEISLPFAPEDDAGTGLIPMGEIEEWHNASTGLPDGHPGLDFQWNEEVEIRAVGDGRILRVSKDEHDKYKVDQALGWFYMTGYQELNRLDPNIRNFSKVKKGQLIGYVGYHRTTRTNEAPKPTDPSMQMHWDFMGVNIFRLCSLEYFDADSRNRLEAIWARVKASGQYKKQYPDICNGAYKNKKE